MRAGLQRELEDMRALLAQERITSKDERDRFERERDEARRTDREERRAEQDRWEREREEGRRTDRDERRADRERWETEKQRLVRELAAAEARIRELEEENRQLVRQNEALERRVAALEVERDQDVAVRRIRDWAGSFEHRVLRFVLSPLDKRGWRTRVES